MDKVTLLFNSLALIFILVGIWQTQSQPQLPKFLKKKRNRTTAYAKLMELDGKGPFSKTPTQGPELPRR